MNSEQAQQQGPTGTLRSAMTELYNALPVGAPDPDAYIPVPPLLGHCPECDGAMEIRIASVSHTGDRVSIGFRCIRFEEVEHAMDPEIWQPAHEQLHELINQLWFFKKHGLPLDRPMNAEEKEVARRLLEEMERSQGGGEEASEEG